MRRASRQSAASYKERSPRLNDKQRINDDTLRSPNGNGELIFKYNNNNRDNDSEPPDSTEVQLLSAPSQTPSDYYSHNLHSNLITHRNSNANAGYSTPYRPIYIRKEKRSMSTFAKPDQDKHVLFKTSSQNDISQKVSDTSFLSVENTGDSSRSSLSVLDEESSDLMSSPQSEILIDQDPEN